MNRPGLPYFLITCQSYQNFLSAFFKIHQDFCYFTAFFELFNLLASVYFLPLKDKIHGCELLSIMNKAKDSFHT